MLHIAHSLNVILMPICIWYGHNCTFLIDSPSTFPVIFVFKYNKLLFFFLNKINILTSFFREVSDYRKKLSRKYRLPINIVVRFEGWQNDF